MAGGSAPDGPKGHLLRGHLPELMRDRTGFLTRCARDHGDIVPLRFGHRRAVLINDPELIGQVLVARSQTYTKPYILRTDRFTIGDGQLGDEGDAVRRQRIAQPAFHKSRMEGYGEVMVAAAERAIDRWRPGETRDVHAEMMRLTLAIVAETLLGVEAEDEATEIGAALRVVMDGFLARLGGLFFVPEWAPTPANRRLRQALARLNATMDQLIARKRALGDDGDDLLSLLLRAADEGILTPQQVRAQTTTFALAGHETTALALTWAWQLLATYPAAEAALTAELEEALGDRAPTPADLPRLIFAQQVIDESLRLFPPIWAMARIARSDDTLGDYPVRAGTVVIVSQWVAQRDPRWFDEPDEFRPERWADGLARRLPKYAYFPFGGGPRGCVGSRFAQQEAVLILATIARRFRLTLAPNQIVTPVPSITLYPRNGVRVMIKERTAGGSRFEVRSSESALAPLPRPTAEAPLSV